MFDEFIVFRIVAIQMLNCILEMVTKTKRVLSLLQQKDHQLRRIIETNDIEWRRRHAELVAQTEDRIVDMRRKAGRIDLSLNFDVKINRRSL